MNLSDKAVFRLAMVIGTVVLVAVILLNDRFLPKPDVPPTWTYTLPLMNAFINGTCSVLLIFSLLAIRKKNIERHKTLNLTAFLLSALFLVSYVVFHFLAKETSFGNTGSIKYFYYTILISHIILAAIVLPLILLSFYHGLKNNTVKHRRITRWSYPIWLYVTISGVIVYVMISPYYPA